MSFNLAPVTPPRGSPDPDQSCQYVGECPQVSLNHSRQRYHEQEAEGDWSPNAENSLLVSTQSSITKSPSASQVFGKAKAALNFKPSSHFRIQERPKGVLSEILSNDPSSKVKNAVINVFSDKHEDLTQTRLKHNNTSVGHSGPSCEYPVGAIDLTDEASILQPSKRKDIDNSPLKPFKKFRPATDFAPGFQGVAAPPRAHLLTRSHYQNGPGNFEIRHRVSLPHIQNNIQESELPHQTTLFNTSPVTVSHNQQYVEYLRKQNQYLEIQLCNRNFECSRQADEMRRANAWASQAKSCMRKDGEDVNHLKMLILYAKNKVEIWEKMLQPLAILESSFESPPEDSTDANAEITNEAKSKAASRIAKDAQEVIRNFDKALKDVLTRPVHQLEDSLDTMPTFQA